MHIRVGKSYHDTCVCCKHKIVVDQAIWNMHMSPWPTVLWRTRDAIARVDAQRHGKATSQRGLLLQQAGSSEHCDIPDQQLSSKVYRFFCMAAQAVVVNVKATLATLKPKGLTVALWQRMPERRPDDSAHRQFVFAFRRQHTAWTRTCTKTEYCERSAALQMSSALAQNESVALSSRITDRVTKGRRGSHSQDKPARVRVLGVLSQASMFTLLGRNCPDDGQRASVVVNPREVVSSGRIKASRSLASLMRRQQARCRDQLYMLLLPCVTGILRMQVCAAVISSRRAADALSLASKHEIITYLWAVVADTRGILVRRRRDQMVKWREQWYADVSIGVASWHQQRSCRNAARRVRCTGVAHSSGRNEIVRDSFARRPIIAHSSPPFSRPRRAARASAVDRL
ncbi:hypothetical protein DOTSEDRAFT_36101 [Dothistroma septosporum NZE10]|uniref:Uncharacterized protein n=1 Tax=Dothistroma septosporum (strain NZE10 / CBS 128990) TaxID=675120 RepID=N1PLK1_DOTSN|nr:hypothetical protein DOTSEDRAFT_36101 [Dothistroma septosporum NZE10]